MKAIYKSTVFVCLFTLFFISNSFSQFGEVKMYQESNIDVPQHQQNGPCLSEDRRLEIKKVIATNLHQLGIVPSLQEESNVPPSFIWPVQKAAHSTANHVYGISNYVDHNTNYPDELTDYNCGDRSYDLDDGYNHQGTDIFLWPFAWHMMDNNEAEVVAAADGTIIFKEGNQFDMNCDFDDPNWNAVYLMHSDGSQTWYGHLKKNSLTSKQVGETVSQGEFLGIVGSSGASTGPHLHFEVYDHENNLIDPYHLSGGCNSLNNSSWWSSQKSYYDSKLNAISTHTALPQFNSCPQAANRNLSNLFIPPDTIFVAAYYSDHLMGQPSTYSLFAPNGDLIQQWTHAPQAPYYSSSYYIWSFTISQQATPGTYTFEVNFMGETLSHEFELMQCQISDLSFSDIECTSDSTYLVTIDFNYSNPASNQFDISDRTNILYSFPYTELPVRVEVPISTHNYELINVSDHQDPACFDEGEFMVNCDSLACHIYDLALSNIECTSDSTYLVTVNFQYDNVTNDFFDLSDRDGILDFFHYDSLPVRVEVPISDHEYQFLKVSDNDNPDCHDAEEFMVNCDSLACHIYDLALSNIECTSDSTYLVTVNFQYDNVTNDFFDLSDRDGILDFFHYDSLPVRVEVPISGLDYEFLKVSDNDNPDCSDAEEFMVNCDSSNCHIYDLELSNIECTSDSTYLVTVNFQYDNVTNDFFDLSDRHGILDFFHYDSLPVRVEVPISGLDYEFLKVSDNDNPDCHDAEEFMVNCDSSSCHIYDLELSNIECASDSTYLVTVNFQYDNVTNDFFDLSDRNGVLDFFHYDSLPVRVEVPISGLDYEFLKVSDNDNPDCHDAEEFMVNCDSTECNIFHLEFSNIECTSDSTFLVTVDFDYENVTNTFFDLSDRDSIIDFFPYADLPVRVELTTSGHNFEYIKVSDNDNPHCYGEAEFEVECLHSATDGNWMPELQLAPNPADQTLFVSGIEHAKYEIYSNIGIHVKSGEINTIKKIPIHDLQSGMYHIRFSTDDGMTFKSFIKL